MVWLLPLQAMYRVFIEAVLFCYAILTVKKNVFLKSADAICALTHVNDNEWQVKTQKSSTKAVLLSDSVMTNYVLFLRFKADNFDQALVCAVFRDSLPEGQFRELVVTARMG